jgi:hypothetical protein
MSYSSLLAGMEMVEPVSAQDEHPNSGLAVIGTAGDDSSIVGEREKSSPE